MTTVNMETLNELVDHSNQSYFEKTIRVVSSLGSFVIDRLAQKDDYQIGKSTITPLYFHENYPFQGSPNIVLGDE
jgi:hypothetical protein